MNEYTMPEAKANHLDYDMTTVVLALQNRK